MLTMSSLFVCRYLNEIELKANDRIKIKSIADMNNQVLSLKLDKLKVQDAGLIKVVARNSLGEASITAEVMVKGNQDFAC